MSTSKPEPADMADRMVVFQERAIRRAWHNAEWWFAIVDVVAVLTDSVQPEGYVKDLRRRDKELAKGWGQIATPLRVETEGGAQRVNCANTEGLFRIIQSIPSPKAEPFKRWLAQVGYERVQEIENPELVSAPAPAICTRSRATRRNGSRSGCARWPFAVNSPTSGKRAACRRARSTASSPPRSPAPRLV